MESFSKYPSESFTIDTDFSDVLGTGETILSGTSTVKVYQDNSAETEVTSSMIEGSVSVSGTKLRARIKAGSEDTNYFVKWTALTSANNTFENIVRLRVLRQIGT
jgi:hypothetical protein